jgi:RNA polymerase sigma-70 factor (ECF subfamily)
MDDTLRERALLGDRAAARALIDAHGPMVYGMCRRLAPTEAEDAYQAIWEKVLRALDRFDPAGSGSLKGWIATIARRHLTDRHRRRTVRGEVVPLDGLAAAGRATDEVVGSRLETARLEAALARLPVEQREVLVHHHLYGVALPELAETSGVALGTLKSRLHRGRARLAELLRGDARFQRRSS